MVKNLLCIFILILIVACDTSNNVSPRDGQYFIKYYGGEGDQVGRDFLSVSDGGFVLLGSSNTEDKGWEIYLVKVDQSGNEEWSYTYGSDGDDFGVGIVLMNDDAYAVVGNTQDSIGNSDIILIKTNLQGEEVSRTTLGDDGFDEEAYAINVVNDGGLIIAGSSTNTEAFPKGIVSPDDTHDFFFPRVDQDLQPLTESNWISRNGFEGTDLLAAGVQKDDGKFVFFGTSDVLPPSNSQKDGTNMILFQTTDDGISDVGDELFGTLSNENCEGISATSDNGFVMVGTTQSDQGVNDVFYARVRSDNSFLAQGALGSSKNVRGKSIYEVDGGGFIITADQLQNDNSDICLIRANSSGGILWENTFGGGEDDIAGKVIQLSDGGFVFTGTVTLENQTKMCLIKTNINGELNP